MGGAEGAEDQRGRHEGGKCDGMHTRADPRDHREEEGRESESGEGGDLADEAASADVGPRSPV